jgi:sterol desaturase/sphingolipid hydroxylase (fatty acid hydroxylase superfamily)
MLESIAAATAGAVLWTLAEYVLHRFVFHGPSASAPGAREHRQHHAAADYFAPWWQKGLAAVAAIAVLLPAVSFATRPATGLSFSVGFVGMYLLYEVLHRRVHTRPPHGAYGRWRRRNHFAHHFEDPRRGHGVTTPVWDAVFGTRLPVARVRIPRRMASPWLLDEKGDLRAEFVDEYDLVGPARIDDRTRRADREAALDNRRPDR